MTEYPITQEIRMTNNSFSGRSKVNAFVRGGRHADGAFGLRFDCHGRAEFRHLICIDRDSGKILWNKGMPAKARVSNYGGFMALHGSPAISRGQLLLRSDKYLYCIGKK